MSRYTTVRWTGEGTGHCGHTPPPPGGPSAHELKGRSVRILLPPHPPIGRPWACGAPLVWMLHDDDVRELFGASWPLVVCEHMVDLD